MQRLLQPFFLMVVISLSLNTQTFFTMKKSLLLAVALAMTTLPLFAQRVTLSGYLKDRSNGEALIGATAYIPTLNTGVTSNAYGFFSLTVPKGTYEVHYSYIGYDSKIEKIDLTANKQVTVSLVEKTEQLNEVLVSSQSRSRNVESVGMSMEKLPIRTAKLLPAFMGEVDVLKTITLLPGIQSGGEGSGGLYVRGGGPDENLVILDEAPVYNASHLMGFFSVFNSDAIKDLDVYKGGIPAEYGGKASSVIDIRMKDGNSQQLGVTGGIGNISSRLTVEAPIIKDKWSFIASGRRTYADVVGRMVGIEELKENSLYFYDLNLKTNIQLGDRDRIYISAYSGDDNFKVGNSIYMRWGNFTTTARWNHQFSSKLFSNTSFIYSDYQYNLGVPSDGADQFDWTSSIRDLNFKEDFSYYISARNKMKFGVNIIHHEFNPGEIEAKGNSFFNSLKMTKYNALEGAVYVSNEQTIGSRLTLLYGMRYSLFQQMGEGRMAEYVNPEKPNRNEVVKINTYERGDLIGDAYGNLEPRLSAKWMLDTESSLKASYNRMVQNLHLISNTASPTPLDVWLPSTKYIKPLIANQVGLGYFRNFDNDMFETSAEVFYKDMTNVIDFIDGAELFFREDLETELLRGDGYAYGLELLVKKTAGKWNGWVGYTLSRSMRQIDGINEGKAYASSYDRTHDLSVVANYSPNKLWTISGSWVFATGNPTSYPIAKYDFQGHTLYYYSERNSQRLPEYHRLDLSATYDFKKNEGRKFKQSLNLSFYNVYCRRNAYSITYRQNEDNPNVSEAVRLSIIGSIIPSITYNFNF